MALLTWQADTFGFAEGLDEAAGRYRGLRGGQVISLGAESAGLLVKPEVARRQLEAETRAPGPPIGPTAGVEPVGGVTSGATPGTTGTGVGGIVTARRPRRFHGTVRLDPARVGRDASRIADEVIAHLAGQVGADVTVTLEIEANLPEGASEQVVRTVTENSRTLKFTSQGFESE